MLIASWTTPDRSAPRAAPCPGRSAAGGIAGEGRRGGGPQVPSVRPRLWLAFMCGSMVRPPRSMLRDRRRDDSGRIVENHAGSLKTTGRFGDEPRDPTLVGQPAPVPQAA